MGFDINGSVALASARTKQLGAQDDSRCGRMVVVEF